MAKSQQTKKNPREIIVKDIQYTVAEDEINPPPPHLVSNFKTLQDWLLNITDNDINYPSNSDNCQIDNNEENYFQYENSAF